jgi:hypothetical protein
MSSNGSGELPPIAERRGAGRARTLLAGKVVFRDGSQSFDCTIRNLTRTGAQIAIAKEHVIPTRVYLMDLRRGVAYEGVVIWIRPPRYGLKLGHAIALEALADPKLDFLKRLWLLAPKPGAPVKPSPSMD